MPPKAKTAVVGRRGRRAYFVTPDFELRNATINRTGERKPGRTKLTGYQVGGQKQETNRELTSEFSKSLRVTSLRYVCWTLFNGGTRHQESRASGA